MSSKHFRENEKKSKQREWVKGLFGEIKNKDTYHQTLQSIRGSDRENHF